MEKNFIDLAGTWSVNLEDGQKFFAQIPGTLDENKIGTHYTEMYENKLTRVYTYEGKAHFTYEFKWDNLWEGKRLFFFAERARILTVLINRKEASPCYAQTLSTPHEFEITDYVVKQEVNVLEIISDNTYEGLPKEAILMASAATDETQTNWNGLLGRVGLYYRDNNFIANIRVLNVGNKLRAEIVIDSRAGYEGTLSCKSEGIKIVKTKKISVEPGQRSRIIFEDFPYAENYNFYEEYQNSLYNMTVEADNMEPAMVPYGIRSFTVSENNKFLLNQHAFLLRGEANCALFPLTGHPPMSKEEWVQILKLYKSYGVNVVRFHSWCPPEAAFAGADELGMFVQPELSQWNPKNALEEDVDYNYYKNELEQILYTYGNHPSFILFTLGNELLTGTRGHQNMSRLLDLARTIDPSRLYANGSNTHYGEIGPDGDSDFYTSMGTKDSMLRAISSYKPETANESCLTGHINNQRPSTMANYTKAVTAVHEKVSQPVYGFEVGQYEIMPDFREVAQYMGVTKAFNLVKIRERAIEKGLFAKWSDYVEASGELSLLCYKEEVEAVLRTDNMSGLSLLGLQDFLGQGTALVGMLNALFRRKPYLFSDPGRFHRFFHSRVPLGMFEKYTYDTTETLKVKVAFTNYEKDSYQGYVRIELWDRTENQLLEVQSLGDREFPNEGLIQVGEGSFDLSKCRKNTECELIIHIGSYENSYPIWVYHISKELAIANPRIKVTPKMDEETLEYLTKGGIVFYTPPAEKEYLPKSIQGQFSNDFWSIGTFPYQEGGMGCLIDTTHPLFENFPTDKHTNWQWWQMTNGRPIILDAIPEEVNPIVEVMDSYCRLNRMANLLECKVGKGKIMISGMGLLQKTEFPEVRALIKAIYEYMESEDFEPTWQMSVDDLKIITGVTEKTESLLS